MPIVGSARHGSEGLSTLHFIILHLAGTIGFVNIARYARNDPRGFFVTGATNYATAAVVAAIFLFVTGNGISFDPPAVLLGAFQGFAYQLMYLVIFVMIGLGGMAISSTINRMAILVPTVGAILIWGEQPTPEQYLGIGAIILATPLMGLDAQRRAVSTQQGNWLLPLTVLISFILLGGSELGSKWFIEARAGSNPADYVFWLFAAATFFSLVTWPVAIGMARREWDRTATVAGSSGRAFAVTVNRRSIGFGIGLGMCNWIQAVAVISALTIFPASFVFPLASASFLVLIAAIDFAAWRQRFSPLTLTGLAVAAVGVVLINLDLGMAARLGW